MEKRARQENTVALAAGEEFPECPNCCAGTLWTLLENAEDDDE